MFIRSFVLAVVIVATSCSDSSEQKVAADNNIIENNVKLTETDEIVDTTDMKMDSSYVIVSATIHDEDFKNLNIHFSNGQIDIEKEGFRDKGKYRFEEKQLFLNMRSRGNVIFNYSVKDSLMTLTQNRQKLILKRTNNT